ncbi:hypothetical protein HK103_002190 [Boothiomyces macroporosus]|uniref:XLF-like N-terminal domain-containing protein n=1 Tax=Boothiomyces macroporosus TaxID=261099 RepID=A0AAD5UDF6_9FUNG|nr:hypothetical protein HK103_002190 [Boothiomyces macroporosus]
MNWKKKSGYYIKYEFSDSGYKFLVTDFKQIFSETINEGELKLKITKYLPLLSKSPTEKQLHIIKKILDEGELIFDSTCHPPLSDTIISLVVTAKLVAKVQLSFTFILVPDTSDLYKELIHPMTLTINALDNCKTQYKKTIKKMSDYIESLGALADLYGIQRKKQPELDWDKLDKMCLVENTDAIAKYVSEAHTFQLQSPSHSEQSQRTTDYSQRLFDSESQRMSNSQDVFNQATQPKPPSLSNSKDFDSLSQNQFKLNSPVSSSDFRAAYDSPENHSTPVKARISQDNSVTPTKAYSQVIPSSISSSTASVELTPVKESLVKTPIESKPLLPPQPIPGHMNSQLSQLSDPITGSPVKKSIQDIKQDRKRELQELKEKQAKKKKKLF